MNPSVHGPIGRYGKKYVYIRKMCACSHNGKNNHAAFASTGSGLWRMFDSFGVRDSVLLLVTLSACCDYCRYLYPL